MAKSPTTSSRVSDAVKRLREDIFEGRYPPGTPLRELAIARELNVSQATIREALQRLEYSGLVTRKLNIGTTVTRLSPKDVRERVTLRALLEVVAAEAAAARMGAADFEELGRRLRTLGSAIESNRYYESALADLEFHRYIWQCSGNDTLVLLLEQVTVPLFAFISLMRSQGLQKLTAVVAAHEPLIEALRSRDSARIRDAFQRGATSSYESFLGDDGPGIQSARLFGYLNIAPGGNGSGS
jgi:DNA-binding GntR family transcriptional regulator